MGCINIYTYIYIPVHIYILLFYSFTCVCIYTHMCMYAHTYIIYRYVYMCTCIYTYWACRRTWYLAPSVWMIWSLRQFGPQHAVHNTKGGPVSPMVEATKLEHDRPPIPTQERRNTSKKSAYIHVPTILVYCGLGPWQVVRNTEGDPM